MVLQFLVSIIPIHQTYVFLSPIGAVLVSLEALTMEYMLLPDDTVLLYEYIEFVPAVRIEMEKQGGIGYYWRLTDDDVAEWWAVYPNSKDTGGSPVTDLPDPIKLIAMLE